MFPPDLALKQNQKVKHYLYRAFMHSGKSWQIIKMLKSSDRKLPRQSCLHMKSDFGHIDKA